MKVINNTIALLVISLFITACHGFSTSDRLVGEILKLWQDGQYEEIYDSYSSFAKKFDTQEELVFYLKYIEKKYGKGFTAELTRKKRGLVLKPFSITRNYHYTIHFPNRTLYATLFIEREKASEVIQTFYIGFPSEEDLNLYKKEFQKRFGHLPF